MEQQSSSSQAGQQQQVPREAKLVSLLLSSSGVTECEPKVIQQLIEFMYRTNISCVPSMGASDSKFVLA